MADLRCIASRKGGFISDVAVCGESLVRFTAHGLQAAALAIEAVDDKQAGEDGKPAEHRGIAPRKHQQERGRSGQARRQYLHKPT